jgi:hypothetical protein
VFSLITPARPEAERIWSPQMSATAPLEMPPAVKLEPAAPDGERSVIRGQARAPSVSAHIVRQAWDGFVAPTEGEALLVTLRLKAV